MAYQSLTTNQNLCELCKEPIKAVELIRRQQVTDTEWIMEYYHEQCWLEKLLQQMRGE